MGQDIRIHWHFHKRCYSIVDPKTGRVIEHSVGPLVLEDVRFIVQPAGHARVLREQVKNVHAFIRGSRIANCEGKRGTRVGYDPYKAAYWFKKSSGQAVDSARQVRLTVTPDGHALVEAWGLNAIRKAAA